MISITTILSEESKARKAYEIGKSAARLTADVAKDVGDNSVKTGSHLYRHKEKYGYGALGAASAIAIQKGINRAKKALE